MQLTELPRRPYRSFEQFLDELRRSGSLLYKCLTCDGQGRVIAPHEMPDPVEGYKMADRIVCPTCAGKREVGRAQAKTWYKGQMTAWKSAYDRLKVRFDVETKAIDKAKKYLSKEELEILEIPTTRRRKT